MPLICSGLYVTLALSTAFRLKEIYEFVQYFELWHTKQCAALSYLTDQSYRNQPVNMMGQGGVGYAKLVLDLSHRRTFITDFHQVSENQKSSVVSQFCQSFCCYFVFHDSIIYIKEKLVNYISKNIEI